MKKIFAILMLIVNVSTAAASNWVVLKTDKEGTISIDQESIIKTGKYVKSWAKHTYTVPQRKKYGVNQGMTFNSSKAQFIYDCATLEMATVSISEYDDDRMIERFDTATSSRTLVLVPAAPDTLGMFMLEYTCYIGKGDVTTSRGEQGNGKTAP